MDAARLTGAFEPQRWNLVFHMKTKLWWLQWLGRFKHVSAFTYIPGAKLWFVYDFQLTGIRTMFFSHAEWIGGVVQDWTRDCEILVIERKVNEKNRLASRFFFYCVPAIKDLIGMTGGALRPDALYRDVLRNGGVRFGTIENPVIISRPGSAD